MRAEENVYREREQMRMRLERKLRMLHRLRYLCAVACLSSWVWGCGGGSTGGGNSTPPPSYVPPTMAPTFSLMGDTSPVHDPSISYQTGVYYAMSTDPGGTTSDFLQIRSSTDKIHWVSSGYVFATMPAFIQSYFAPTVLTSLWAPDVSFFNGLYHLYYAASDFGTNTSLIALATSPTLNPADPSYGWTSHGIVISSNSTSSFNTIDPSVWVDTDAKGNATHVWLTYGSYFGGIFQRELDPATGMTLASNPANVNLATRPGVPNNPIEGTSLVKHNGYYYLFASFDYCCNANPATDNYKIAVGRSTSPQGPFTDMNGVSMLDGGGTILLESGTNWIAPGGATVLIDPGQGDVIAYHALSVQENYLDFLFVDSLTWPSDWPAISQ
jgi:arabinan endo-1,5-alpha-L-arabinosidase